MALAHAFVHTGARTHQPATEKETKEGTTWRKEGRFVGGFDEERESVVDASKEASEQPGRRTSEQASRVRLPRACR